MFLLVQKKGVVNSKAAYQSQLARIKVLQELKALATLPVIGVYVAPFPDNMLELAGVVFVTEGHFKTGVFRFTISIPCSYPSTAPTISFSNPVYHPLVSLPPAQNLDTSVMFSQWNSKQHNLRSVLGYVKDIFTETGYWEERPSAVNRPVNSEAQQKWVHKRAEFIRLCKQCAADSVALMELEGGSRKEVDKTEDTKEPHGSHMSASSPFSPSVLKAALTPGSLDSLAEPSKEVLRRLLHTPSGVNTKHGDSSHNSVDYLPWFGGGVERLL
mmetsp:Transcript_41356/g.81094  ORF Transcript_41356/g.81094 Transcript_41356/m.81094 type:complete len:271 (-) Transcript_41356:261-1073(-)